MVIVRIMGGLGNQLSCFVFGYTISQYLGQPLILDISHYTAGYFRNYMLDYLSLPQYTKLAYAISEDTDYFSLDSVSSTILDEMDLIISSEGVVDRNELLQAITGYRNVYACGYGGIAFCSDSEIDYLRKNIHLQGKWTKFNSFKDQLNDDYNVAIHVRRTDFLTEKWTSDSWDRYYNTAINWFRNNRKNCRFYIFSDDVEWVRKNLMGSDIVIFENIGGEIHSIEDMFCMALCRGFILTNKSSYGWWGSFFSTYENGINIINASVDYNETTQIPLGLKDTIRIEGLAYDKEQYGDSNDSKIVLSDYHIEDLLVNNQNDQVFAIINNCSSSNYNNELLEYKAIAYLQDGESQLAKDCYEVLMHNSSVNSEMLFNYAIIQEKCNRHKRAIAYAAMASKKGIYTNPLDFINIDNYEDQLIFDAFIQCDESTEFLFVYDAPSRFFNGYIESIFLFMKSLGLNVDSIMRCGDYIFNTEKKYVLIIDKDKVYGDIAKFEGQIYRIDINSNDTDIHMITDKIYDKERGMDSDRIIVDAASIVSFKPEVRRDDRKYKERSYRVSIIIPCYNVENYIENCMDSIVSQSVGIDTLQIICIDDCSTDRTSELLTKYKQLYPKQVSILENETNKGPGYCRNIGLNIANGDFVAFVDADDFIFVDMVKIMLQHIIEEDADIVMCGYAIIDTNNRVKVRKCLQNDVYDMNELKCKKKYLIEHSDQSAVWARLYKRSLVENNKIRFPEAVYMEDIYFSQLTELCADKIITLSDVLYGYRVNPVGIMRGEDRDERIIDSYIVQEATYREIVKRGLQLNIIEEMAFIYYLKAFYTLFCCWYMKGYFTTDEIEILCEVKVIINNSFPRIDSNEYIKCIDSDENRVAMKWLF